MAQNGQRVLVIDDEEPIRSALHDVLLDQGYDVRTVGDGQQGLEIMQEWPPDVILLDLSMPVMGGSAFRNAQLGLSEDLRNVPIITLTGVRDAVEQARQIGAVAVLQKPFDLDELEGTITRVLEARVGNSGGAVSGA